LKRLQEVATIIPAVNQVEIHPLLSQRPLVDYCSNLGITMQAYSPFARMHEKLITNSALVSIAENLHKSVTQVILRWNYQNNIISVPKASSLKHLKGNLDIFDFTLSEKEMSIINDQNIDFRVRHNPDNCDFSKL
jgi:diketogulonate reductase-like aldo/keto reductase